MWEFCNLAPEGHRGLVLSSIWPQWSCSYRCYEATYTRNCLFLEKMAKIQFCCDNGQKLTPSLTPKRSYYEACALPDSPIALIEALSHSFLIGSWPFPPLSFCLGFTLLQTNSIHPLLTSDWILANEVVLNTLIVTESIRVIECALWYPTFLNTKALLDNYEPKTSRHTILKPTGQNIEIAIFHRF